MPRVKPTASEKRRNELSARIRYHMSVRGYDNKTMAKHLGVSERTFTEKKIHCPDEFSVSEVWAMEKLFGCRLSEPISIEG